MVPSCHYHRKSLFGCGRFALPFPSLVSLRSLRFRSAFPHPENRTVKVDLKLFLQLLFASSACLAFAWLTFPLLSSNSSFRSSPRPISISKLPHYCAFTADLSTLSSLRGLTRFRDGNLLLEVGFTLRCLQRLSAPHFASQLCRWHDNCCTRDASTPVLSY